MNGTQAKAWQDAFGKLVFWLFLIGAAVGMAILAGLCFGCSSPPTAFEQRFFNIETNYVPSITVHTQQFYQTNIVQRDVFTTNIVDDVTLITITPVRDVTVLENAVLTYQTNMQVHYTYTANTNAASVASIGGAIAAPFGLGGIVSSAIAGVFGIWAAARSRRNGKVAAGLTQGIEVLSEVLKTTPQGQLLDEKAKAWLQSHQLQTGTALEVVKLLNTVVDNESAREIAAKIQAEISARLTKTQ
jgi:hypothetical protein